MARHLIALVVVLSSVYCGGIAQDNDDILKRLLAKSNAAVVGKITSIRGVDEGEVGVLRYNCVISVSEILKGDRTLKSIYVSIKRYELEESDRLIDLKTDSKYILFLKKARAGNVPNWETADAWFGVHRHGPLMARELKQLAGEME
jgi:hypothetical protein